MRGSEGDMKALKEKLDALPKGRREKIEKRAVLLIVGGGVSGLCVSGCVRVQGRED